MKMRQSRYLAATFTLVGLLFLCGIIYTANERMIQRTEKAVQAMEELIAETESESEENMQVSIGEIKIPETLPANATEMEETTETEEDADPEIRLQKARKDLPDAAEYEVKAIKQNPELPTGCESVSLTMALNYYGFNLKKTDIADDYLVYDAENFLTGYMGDPYTEMGAGIYPPGLTATANAFLQSKKSEMKAYDLLGTDFEDLYAYVAADCPVLLWTTITYEDPIFEDGLVEYEGEVYHWFSDEHCVLMTGYDLDEEVVQLADPLEGEVEVDIETIESIYNKIGKPAVTIY